MKLPLSFAQLIDQAQREALYTSLILQLNKDFRRANLDGEFGTEITPEALIKELSGRLKVLMESDFDNYLNLLYAVDVSESKVRSLDLNDTEDLGNAVAFLILQREWQKVWLKKHLS